MRALGAVARLMLTGLVAARAAEPPRLAAFEMIDSSLQGQMDEPRVDQHDRTPAAL